MDKRELVNIAVHSIVPFSFFLFSWRTRFISQFGISILNLGDFGLGIDGFRCTADDVEDQQ